MQSGWVRAGLGPRSLIKGAVVGLALIVITSIGWQVWLGTNELIATYQVQRANRLTDDLIRVAGIQARERGLTSLALGGPVASEARGHIERLRREGDQLWDTALDRALRLSANRPELVGLQGALAQAESVRQAHLTWRGRVDTWLNRGRTAPAHVRQEWFGTATRAIEAGADLRRAVLAEVPMPRALAYLNQQLQADAWAASEHAGWERGALAFYLAAERPVPEGVLVSLRFHQRLADQHLAALQAAPRRRDLDPRLDQALTGLARFFREEVGPLRERVYAAADTGDYPVSATQWWESYTAAIDRILALSRTVSKISSERAQELVHREVGALTLYALLLGLMGGLAVLAFRKTSQSADALHYQKELAEVTLSSIGDAVVTTDAQGRLTSLNTIAETLTGYTTDEARGRPVGDVLRLTNQNTGGPAANPAEVSLRTGEITDLDDATVLTARDGTVVPIEDSGAPIRDRHGQIVGAVLVFYDVSKHDPQHLLAYQATHDPVTKLANRREFERRVAELLTRSRSDGSEHALCYIDLDQFKIVNDTAGHTAGDQLLQRVAQVLQQQVRRGDMLARIGGDEFGILLADCPLDQAEALVKKFQDEVASQHFEWQDQSFQISVSVGITAINAASPSPAETLGEADTACFAAKERSGRHVQAYRLDDDDLRQRRGEMDWVPVITAALERDWLELNCQPIVTVDGAEPRLVEVLARIRLPDGRCAAPDQFIPAAERYGLMPRIDQWVVQRTLRALDERIAQGEDLVPHCINLSGLSVSDVDFPDFLVAQLETASVPAEALCFEITETAAVTSFAQASHLIDTLRQRGHRFALDDVGSGLSFGYLKHLPVDYLKIDGLLVEAIPEDPVSRAMVQAIHEVGRSLGIATIAEHVSSSDIIEHLREMGIDLAQGFATGPPRTMALRPIADG